jgi:hypothetical protein
VTGVGDTLVSAKYRFHLRQETGFQSSHALILGWRLPTGADDRTDANGARLSPSDQPGSEHHGVEVGYATDREKLIDSAWVSAFYRHEFGEGFRRGEMIDLDVAYGRWVVRPNEADDLGINLAIGVHAESSADDRSENGRPIGNAHKVAGLHMTPIITKGRHQYRIGIFVPVIKAGNRDETDFRYQVRASWEMFF